MSAKRAPAARRPAASVKSNKSLRPSARAASRSSGDASSKKDTRGRAAKPPALKKKSPSSERKTPPKTKKIAARTVQPAPARAQGPAKLKTSEPKRLKAPTPAPPPKKKATRTRTEKETKMVETAKPTPPRAVVRIARGLRTPKPVTAAAPDKDTTRPRREGPPSTRRPVGPKIEVNPRLERSKHLVNGAATEAPGPKPMSVAAKHRAAAEAVFAKLTGPETAPAAEPTPVPYAARPADQGGGAGYAARINEQDSLVTSLRLSSSREETLAYARQLAERFKLPPDQSMLLRVIALEDAKLTKLALEELLELEDRGRVRPSAELRMALGAIQTKDPETLELKQLLAAKIGGAA